MNKIVCIAVCMLFGVTALSAQDVRYYKLSSTRIGGTTNKNVSGGQFVNFISDICFESNNKGVGVGHGTLTRNDNYSNSQYTTYQGSNYWGNNTTFKFNADKSVLNVVLDNGDIYVYKRATPPAGVTTSSLIRKKKEGGGYIPTPNPLPQYTPQPPVPPSPAPDPYRKPDSPQPTPTPQRTQCGCCGGTGRVEKDDAISLGFQKKYCNECRREVFASHYHAPCNCCNGRGYLK